jgi:hypothetical protein
MNISNLTNEANSTEGSISEIDITVLIIEICLSVLAFALNLLTIFLIARTITKKKTYSSVIFLLITITDLIVGCISIPGDAVLTYIGSWPYLICVFYKTFDYANGNFSLMLLLVITLHRWLQLKDPFRQKEKMNRYRWFLIVMLLVFNYGVWLALWSIYFYNEENGKFCYFKSFDIYIYAYNCGVTISTFILIILMNILIIREFIIKKSKHLASKSKKEDNAIYCILAITANLIVNWGLFIFTWSIIIICDNCVPYDLYKISYLLNYSFATINPIILLVFNQNYRTVLLRKLNINVTENKFIQKTVTTVRVNE